MLNECEQLWASRAAQAFDARLTNHVVAPSVNPALDLSNSLTDDFHSSNSNAEIMYVFITL